MSIPLPCRFGWHAWPKWTEIRQGRYVSKIVCTSDPTTTTTSAKKDLEDGLGSIFKEQQRICDGCGKVQLRTERA